MHRQRLDACMHAHPLQNELNAHITDIMGHRSKAYTNVLSTCKNITELSGGTRFISNMQVDKREVFR